MSKEEAATYFRNLSTKLGPTKRAPSTGARGLPPARGASEYEVSKLLTQVSISDAKKAPREAKGDVNEKELDRKLQAIRMQPKNASPIDASRHPSLLPKQMSKYIGKKCLVLDVDETLVHSSYHPVHKYDLHLALRVNGSICNVYVAYRPFLREFIEAIAPLFEVVVFTASVSLYCDPVMNEVDPDRKLGNQRLFREHCSIVNGSYVKDLSLTGRPLDTIAIIDNSPVAYLFQQRNAIPILSWFDNPDDNELMKLIPMLEELARAPTVYDVLDPYNARLQLQQ